jgi:hypothetical protein
MTLFSGKLIALFLALIVVFGFGTGLLWINHDKQKCFQTRYWNMGSWHTVFALGRLEFRARTIDYTCDPEWRLDPHKWQKDASGNITPIDS